MNNLLVAQFLMGVSSFFASIVSLDANYLTHANDYYHWGLVLFANGVVGLSVCVIVWAVEYTLASPTGIDTTDLRNDDDEFDDGDDQKLLASKGKPSFLGSKSNRNWLILRGIFGAAENTCAWLALRYLKLAEANVLMFTNPAITGLLAYFLLGQKWLWFDWLLSGTSLVGVILVVRPWHDHDAHSAGAPSDMDPSTQHWVGVAAALGFALTLSGANLIINEKIKAESTNTVSAWLFMAVVATVWPIFLFTNIDGYADHSAATLEFWALLGVGVIFYLFQMCRSKAFMLSRGDASVVNLLYLEIFFAFVWGIGLLHQKAPWEALLGAAIIITGSICAGISKKRYLAAASEESESKEPQQERERESSLSSQCSVASMGMGGGGGLYIMNSQ